VFVNGRTRSPASSARWASWSVIPCNSGGNHSGSRSARAVSSGWMTW
jgi:hypothetical protein